MKHRARLQYALPTTQVILSLLTPAVARTVLQMPIKTLSPTVSALLSWLLTPVTITTCKYLCPYVHYAPLLVARFSYIIG